MDKLGNMNESHLSDDEMIQHFYDGGSAGHLAVCVECQTRFAALRTLLHSVDSIQVPERGDDYGAQVWSRLQGRLHRAPSRHWRAWAAIAAMLAIGVTGFLLGRRVEVAESGSRVLLVALTGHLERSQMVMTELSNAATPDIRYEREEASELLESNRLYRQSAAQQGDTQTVVLLEDLERLLLEIAHSPDRLGSAEIDDLRRKVEEQSFKVKVLSNRLERQTNERGNKL